MILKKGMFAQIALVDGQKSTLLLTLLYSMKTLTDSHNEHTVKPLQAKD